MNTASTTIPQSQPIPERSSRTYRATLVDMDSIALPPSQVTSIKFSLRDDRTDIVINSRFRVEILNANGGLIEAGGLFSMVLSPQDTVSTGTSKLQKRRMLFEVDYVGGHENHEVFFWVENLEDIPQSNLGDQELFRVTDTVYAMVA